jgi:hypothetical protein
MFTFQTDGGEYGGDKGTMYAEKLPCEDDLYTVALASFFWKADTKTI